MGEPSIPVIDVHVHLAGRGDGGTGCRFSPSYARDPRLYYLIWSLGLWGVFRSGDLDAGYVSVLLSALDGCPEVDGVVAFALDDTHTRDGTPLPDKTGVYVPNDYVLRLAKDHSNVHAGISVHPARKDAVKLLEEGKAKGAVLCKWIPNCQGMDPSDEAWVPFYKALASLDLPLLCHTGLEGALPTVDQKLGNPDLLDLPLKHGVTVIAGHAATGADLLGRSTVPSLVRMAKEYDHFYADVSCADLLWHVLHVKAIRRAGAPLTDRLLYGSDFPLPILAPSLFPVAGWRASRQVAREKNLVRRSYLAKRVLGFDDAVFTRAARVLKIASSDRQKQVTIPA